MKPKPLQKIQKATDPSRRRPWNEMNRKQRRGIKSDPNLHRAHKRPTQSTDRSTATRVA